jgi:hypothetical protein
MTPALRLNNAHGSRATSPYVEAPTRYRHRDDRSVTAYYRQSAHNPIESRASGAVLVVRLRWNEGLLDAGTVRYCQLSLNPDCAQNPPGGWGF